MKTFLAFIAMLFAFYMATYGTLAIARYVRAFQHYQQLIRNS